MMAITSRICSPYSYALVVDPFPINLTTGILQVIDRSRLVVYYFYIPTVEELNTSRAFYWGQGFVIKAIQTT